MAKYTKVEELQKHLEIDYLETGDENYLHLLLKASESRIEKEINQSFDKFVDEEGVLDSALVAAILIFAATLYASREAVSYSKAEAVPFTLGYLVQPFIKYV